MGRDKATGQGLVYCLEGVGEAPRLRHLEGSTFFVQGFGNVGSHAARIMQRRGARMLAVSDHTGSIGSANGIDAEELATYVAAQGGVKGYPQAGEISLSDFFSTKADIFIPAALECTINVETESLIKARTIIEGANGPTTLEAERRLTDRGVIIIPDVLANSGGVTVSYFEWVQNKNSETWDLAKVDEELHRVMARATEAVIDETKSRKCEPRTAAMTLALARIERSYRERGIFP